MSQKTIFHYALRSTSSHPGEPELKRIAVLAGAAVEYRPIDVHKVFVDRSATEPHRHPDEDAEHPAEPAKRRA